MINEDSSFFKCNNGHLVHVILPLTSQLRTSSRKVAIKYIGSFVIYKVINLHNYLLMTLDDKILRWLFEYERLKADIIRAILENVYNLLQLQQVLNGGINLDTKLLRILSIPKYSKIG